jgi:hypothetical protein
MIGWVSRLTGHLGVGGIVGLARSNRSPILLALAVIAFYSPVVLLGRAFYLKDSQLVVYPTRLLLRERLLAFDLPEWLPHLDMGMPFLANPSNGVLYPLNVLLALPAPWCVGLFVVSHGVIAVVGAWLLLRALRVTNAASAGGAIAFALGGYMVSLTWVANYMMGLAWLPLVAWMALRTMRSGRIGDAALTGFVWAMQILCGEPQGVVLTGWFVLALGTGFPSRATRKWRQLALLGLAAILAACIALPQILPALDLLPRSRRAAGIQLSEASHWSLHPLRLLELLVPNLFGNPTHFNEFLGFFMDDESSRLHRDPWIASPYFGSTVLLFAVSALAGSRIRHRHWVRSLGVLLALSLLLALGRHSPVFALYFQHVPAAQLFRYPAKIFGLSAAILPLLGAAGFDAWRSKPSMRMPWYGAWTVVLGLLLGLWGAPSAARELQELRPDVTVTAATQTLRTALSIELALFVPVGVVLALARRKSSPIYVGALLGLAVLQIVRANLGAYDTVPGQVYAEPALARSIRAQTPMGEPPRIMHEVPALEIPGLDSASGTVRAQALTNILMKDLGIVYGIGYADSYVSSEEGAKFEFWRNLGPFRRQMLDVFTVRHLILASNIAMPDGSGLRPVTDIGPIGAVAYENLNALPFAYAVAKIAVVETQAAAQLALRDVRIARGLLGVIEGPDAEGSPNAPAERIGTCQLAAPLGDRIDLECDLRRDGYVIVNASHHPNFSAQLDGAPARILRANAFVMATKSPAGKHRLRFEYSEGSLLLACSASFCACLLSLLLVYRESRARSHASSPGAPA